MRIDSMKDSIYGFYKVLFDLNVILVYEGLFDQEIIKSFLNMTDKKLSGDGVEDMLRKKLFNVIMESLQNICKHQKVQEHDTPNALFLLGTDNEDYYIVTGNYISKDKIKVVQNKLDEINSLDKEGLKELYKNLRLKSVISDVGGAGLGFVDIARKSGNKFEYHFAPVDDHISFFSLKTLISKKN
jgi:hypothetical protein